MRYTSGIKAYEDEHQVVFCGVHRGVGMTPLTDDEEDLIHRLGQHLSQALDMHFRMQTRAGPASVGLETLRRLPYPIVLMDESRHVIYRNDKAHHLMAAGGLVQCRQGLMCGPDPNGDAQLLLALRTLGLSNSAYLGQGTLPVANKAFVRLENSQGEWLGVHCRALRSADSMGAFGARDLALVLLHEPGLLTEPDPFVVAAMWDLSPAEAQVMVGLARGQTLQDMAQQRGVAMSTIRSQLRSTLSKTGASRQAELVSLLASMPPVLT